MNLVRKHLSPVSTFVVLAYVISWVLWVPVVVIFPDVADPPWWAIAVAFVGIFGPSIAAVITAAIRGGRSEVHALVAKLCRWRVGWFWYALVLITPPAFVWGGVAVFVALGGSVSIASMTWPLSAALILATFVPFGPLGEELGWRGYALPRLDKGLSPLTSSVLLGVIWAAWHAPMFWFPPIGLPSRSISSVGMWAANVVGFSILLSFVARRTRYSVPIAILLHATLNAGPAMGLSSFTIPASSGEEIRSWAGLVRWFVVLAAAVALGRERRKLPEPAKSPV